MMAATTRRAARAKLRELGLTIPSPFTVEALCASVSRHRGRPVRLVELDFATDIACGRWIETQTVDYICVDRNASVPLREHIVLHEVAHILCEHRGILGPILNEFKLLDPEMVRRVLGRTVYDEVEEREAELLASEIGSRVERDDRRDDAATRDVLDGLSAVMSGKHLPQQRQPRDDR
ncbi:hypothetical protein [Rhizomonospora bruguierae]|uniref:hypothetical protein n=1 Tax=Rhizomonospora bruguierae TaxID=1581705 RepID=UPI001BCCEDC4|nr:hypothetical protein [Micromonospora sp. NBRC 107566]